MPSRLHAVESSFSVHLGILVVTLVIAWAIVFFASPLWWWP